MKTAAESVETAASPTFGHIRAQVAAIRRKVPDARVIGIRAQGRWTGETFKQDGQHKYHIEQCDSPLQMRVALQVDDPEVTTKVLITGLADTELGDDVLVRLTKRRLFPIDRWQIVKTLFQANSIDPRVAGQAWIAERLLELAPPEGYPPVAGAFLDAETVWGILLDREIGLTLDGADLQALLTWSISAECISRFQLLPEDFRKAAVAWMGQTVGAAAEAVLACVEANKRPDALPIGLACAIVFDSRTAGRLDLAAGRIEKHLGVAAPSKAIIQRWHEAATEVVSRQLTDTKIRREQLSRADEILREIEADSHAYLSDTSPLGFDQRLARYGMALAGVVKRGAYADLAPLMDACTSLTDHLQCRLEHRRVQRVEMSLRLVRWLSRVPADGPCRPQSFVEAAKAHMADGCFADWARLTLRAGDPVRELSAAYTTLLKKVLDIREQQARDFAELLRDWTAAGSSGKEVIPVELILKEVVAPLAANDPVLLIVIDGMSAAVSRELIADVARQGWVQLCEENRTCTRPGMATIPSKTEVSRTSLFCGKLVQGDSSSEVSGFTSHPDLLAHCRSGSPPVLFHKIDLQDPEDSGIAAAVRHEILSSQRRIVGVVVNAVDDHLLKGEQLDIRWTRDEIKALPTLLHEARVAGRVVVIVSDHGHVLDHQTKQCAGEGGERWREAEGAPDPEELLIKGKRVVIPERHELIGPWSEKVRYGMKKNGYHGGLSPQEMVIPITVLSAGALPIGWTEAAIETPVWWDEAEEVGALKLEPEAKPSKGRGKKKPEPDGMLFDLDEPEPQRAPKAAEMPSWLKALLASPVFEDQKKLGGRALPPDKQIVALLTYLEERGGKMTSTALARKLEMPVFRLRGLLAVMQRLLNIDGYGVLMREDASDTIAFNRELLCRQFDLK